MHVNKYYKYIIYIYSYIHICMCVHILSSDYLGCRCPFKYVYVTSGSTMLWHGSCAMLYVKIYMSICVMFIVNVNVHVMFMSCSFSFSFSFSCYVHVVLYV